MKQFTQFTRLYAFIALVAMLAAFSSCKKEFPPKPSCWECEEFFKLGNIPERMVRDTMICDMSERDIRHYERDHSYTEIVDRPGVDGIRLRYEMKTTVKCKIKSPAPRREYE
jgi:hypothetical protein